MTKTKDELLKEANDLGIKEGDLDDTRNATLESAIKEEKANVAKENKGKGVEKKNANASAKGKSKANAKAKFEKDDRVSEDGIPKNIVEDGKENERKGIYRSKIKKDDAYMDKEGKVHGEVVNIVDSPIDERSYPAGERI